MYKNRKLIYGLLFTIFFFLEALHLFPHFIPTDSPIEWLKPLGHYAPIALALLLLFILRMGEVQQERLEEAVHVGGNLVTRIEIEGKRLTDLSEETHHLMKTTKELAEQLRSSDALLHGKLFYFQQDYPAAIQIFEEIYSQLPSEAEVNRWLGLSLLRDRQPKRALPLLEFAAKARQHDPELWYASGEAKFKSWDRSLFASAEEEVKKALSLGFRNREIAQTLLARIQLTRDRTTAKLTLRDGLSRNPGSPQLATELARVLIDEHDLQGVIELADRALLLNRRNWAMYPLRADAYVRRREIGDFDRARSDLEEAKRGNNRDFNVHRIEAELALAQADAAATDAERRIIISEARDKLLNLKDQYRHGLKSQVLALRSRLSMRLGDSDDCVNCAQEAVKSAEQQIPNLHFLLCAALTQKRSWVQLSRAAQHMRETFPVPAIHAWSSLYILLAELESNQSIAAMQETIHQCQTDLALFPGFDPTVRPEWRENRWKLPNEHLLDRERNLLITLNDFLVGQRSYDSFTAELSTNANAGNVQT